MSRTPRIHVCSFSYHGSGIPADPTGHGGGFVFDCRFLPNPGREERYRDRTGRDPDVASFLEAREEARAFRERVFRMVEDAVEGVRAKEYEDFTVCFGCTGGRHRSVWLAEELCRHLSGRGERCDLTHHDLPGENP
ncbi:MAG: ATP-binding protein [Candidatus Eisenbacteria bacterium]|nr:ATP-binding protein [Candidatus Eisenbacteria bacterium]